MRSRPDDARVTEVTRRRLVALTAELAAARGELPTDAGQDVGPALTVGRTELPAAGASAPGGRHALRPMSRSGRLTGWIADRLPAAVPRAPLGTGHAGLVLVIVAAGLALCAWWLVRAGGIGWPEGEAAPTVAVSAPPPAASGTPSSGATPAPSSGTPSAVGGTSGPGAADTAGAPSSSGDQMVVDVVGKVRRPGIVVLPVGSRVVDAVRAAGGMRPGVGRGSVNLARLLTDGEQVLVGVPGAGGVPGTAPAPSLGAGTGTTLVNLNTADQATLETLPGVGPVTAQAILQWRTDHGGFTAVEELLEVSGIGDATLAEIAPFVTL